MAKALQAGPSEGGGTDGAKLRFVEKKYANSFDAKGNHVYCILTDKEPVRTFVCRELASKMGKRYERIYDCTRLQKLCFKHCGQGKPVKHYYIYWNDPVLTVKGSSRRMAAHRGLGMTVGEPLETCQSREPAF